jgi:hypothetical protein
LYFCSASERARDGPSLLFVELAAGLVSFACLDLSGALGSTPLLGALALGSLLLLAHLFALGTAAGLVSLLCLRSP